MSEPKSFASLSPSLLARKGGARPAMRSQFQSFSQAVPEASLRPALNGHHLNGHHHGHHPQDDLGWNDMGEDDMPEGPELLEPAEVVPFNAAVPYAPPEHIPTVVRQQDEILDRLADEPPPEPPRPSLTPEVVTMQEFARRTKVSDAGSRRSALADGRRAAFTLRVDEDRHLKLRLACTVQGRSAQQLVTEALDRLLDALPEVDDLARRVKRR